MLLILSKNSACNYVGDQKEVWWRWLILESALGIKEVVI
jgi:hypothetical protein